MISVFRKKYKIKTRTYVLIGLGDIAVIAVLITVFENLIDPIVVMIVGSMMLVPICTGAWYESDRSIKSKAEDVGIYDID